MSKHTEKLELIAIDKLIPYANNARTHSPDQVEKLRASLREFGFVNPILVDRDYGIIAGHGRLMAAQAEGMETVPCVFVEHLTETQKRAYILADNKLAELAGWDAKRLSSELDALTDSGFDLSIAGFEDFDIPFDAFDGEGDGGGSMMSNGTKVRVTIGALMFDIEDNNHAIYDKTKDADADYVQAQIVDLIARGELL